MSSTAPAARFTSVRTADCQFPEASLEMNDARAATIAATIAAVASSRATAPLPDRKLCRGSPLM